GKVSPKATDGVWKAGRLDRRFAVTFVQAVWRRSSGPHPIRRFAPPSPASWGRVACGAFLSSSPLRSKCRNVYDLKSLSAWLRERGMNGAQSLVQTLVDCGVEICFANPGTSEMHFVGALDSASGMRPVLCLFEGVATGAAD